MGPFFGHGHGAPTAIYGVTSTVDSATVASMSYSHLGGGFGVYVGMDAVAPVVSGLDLDAKLGVGRGVEAVQVSVTTLFKRVQFDDDDCVATLQPGERIGPSFIFVASFFSLSAVLVLLAVYVRDAFKLHRRSHRSTRENDSTNATGAPLPTPAPQRTHSAIATNLDIYFLSLLVGEMFLALSGILSLSVVAFGRLSCHQSICVAQGVLGGIGSMSVAGSLGAIAVHTAYVILLHGRPVGKCVGIGVTGGIWFVVLLFVLVPYGVRTSMNGHYFAPSPTLCSIGKEYTGERVGVSFLPLWLTLALSSIVYTSLFLFLRGNLVIVVSGRWSKVRFRHAPTPEPASERSSGESRGSDTGAVAGSSVAPGGSTSEGGTGVGTTRTASVYFGRGERIASSGASVFDCRRRRIEALKMLWYPASYTVLVLPLSIARLNPSLSSSPTAQAVSGALFHLSGICNVILFTVTRPNILLFGSNISSDSVNGVGGASKGSGRDMSDAMELGELPVRGAPFGSRSGTSSVRGPPRQKHKRTFTNQSQIQALVTSRASSNSGGAGPDDFDVVDITSPNPSHLPPSTPPPHTDRHQNGNGHSQSSRMSRSSDSHGYRFSFKPLTLNLPSSRISSIYTTWAKLYGERRRLSDDDGSLVVTLGKKGSRNSSRPSSRGSRRSRGSRSFSGYSKVRSRSRTRTSMKSPESGVPSPQSSSSCAGTSSSGGSRFGSISLSHDLGLPSAPVPVEVGSVPVRERDTSSDRGVYADRADSESTKKARSKNKGKGKAKGRPPSPLFYVPPRNRVPGVGGGMGTLFTNRSAVMNLPNRRAEFEAGPSGTQLNIVHAKSSARSPSERETGSPISSRSRVDQAQFKVITASTSVQVPHSTQHSSPHSTPRRSTESKERRYRSVGSVAKLEKPVPLSPFFSSESFPPPPPVPPKSAARYLPPVVAPFSPSQPLLPQSITVEPGSLGQGRVSLVESTQLYSPTLTRSSTRSQDKRGPSLIIPDFPLPPDHRPDKFGKSRTPGNVIGSPTGGRPLPTPPSTSGVSPRPFESVVSRPQINLQSLSRRQPQTLSPILPTPKQSMYFTSPTSETPPLHHKRSHSQSFSAPGTYPPSRCRTIAGTKTSLVTEYEIDYNAPRSAVVPGPGASALFNISSGRRGRDEDSGAGSGVRQREKPGRRVGEERKGDLLSFIDMS